MSHFAVLVATRSPDELAAALQPYHEYECTGTRDQYVTFVTEDEATLRAEHAKMREDGGTKEDFGQWVGDYYGYELHEGMWGRWTNPNKKWDWWKVGGRWSGSLLLRDGTKTDEALKRDVDVAGMLAESAREAAIEWDEMDHLTGGERWRSWNELCGGNPKALSYKEIDAARHRYWAQPALAKLSGSERFKWYRDTDDLLMHKDEFVRVKSRSRVAMFALLANGVWHERGRVGWWATVSDDKGTAWEEEYFALFDSIPGGNFVTVVDCHI